tara:strand:+ start:573 stop:839 length:267 start_codon:yes stop_codon:yes gene_type:complete
MKRIKKEDIKAKPAPGPIYASTLSAKLNNSVIKKSKLKKNILLTALSILQTIIMDKDFTTLYYINSTDSLEKNNSSLESLSNTGYYYI